MSTAQLTLPTPVNFVTNQPNVPHEITESKISVSIRTVAQKPASLLSTIVEQDLCFEKLPFPGQMAFNDTQTAYLTKHTPPRVSAKITKLIDLNKIAYAQEKAGIRFEGRLTFAEAQVALLQEVHVQSSQSSRISNPYTFLTDSIKYLQDGISYYFQSSTSVDNLVDLFSEPIGTTKFTARMSASLSARVAAGETCSTFGVLLVDSGHTSISVQNGIKAFLEKNFKLERGDIFLTEAAAVFQEKNGEKIALIPSLEDHYTSFCMGIPLQSCQFFHEPEKDVAFMLSVMSERRTLVLKVFEFLMSAIPPEKAREARLRLENYNSKTSGIDTEFRMKLMIEYQDFCHPAKEAKFSSYVDPLGEAVEKEIKAQLSVAGPRDRMYIQQLTQAIKQLKPGARLFYTMGQDHAGRLANKIDRLDTIIVDIDISNCKDEL